MRFVDCKEVFVIKKFELETRCAKIYLELFYGERRPGRLL